MYALFICHFIFVGHLFSNKIECVQTCSPLHSGGAIFIGALRPISVFLQSLTMWGLMADLSSRNEGNQGDIATVRYTGLVFSGENHFTVDDDIEIRIIEDVCCFRVFTSQMLA